ncbi:MAG: hypothetical protein H0U76_13780 [Ktedonobacteraceae bacterium]|nr:hypothetical protein [Ktedonobacteraceae bacterium]
MKSPSVAFRTNLKLARFTWGPLSKIAVQQLKKLTLEDALVVANGDLQLLQGRWYVTHTGLLRLSHRKRCHGIITTIVARVSDPNASRWVFKATVYKSADSHGFVGFGDADPFNVSDAMRGAELRIAETRSVNRALRKAYGIGICSVEELGSSRSIDPGPATTQKNRPQHHPNGSNNAQPRLRDQLSVLIRQHNLDPTLVKSYAADFCGTATLSGATRDSIESFISHLSSAARENRDGLICKLNSYAQPAEAHI